MSSFAYLAVVQQNLTRYGMTTYVTLGNIGLLFNILVFSQPAHRRNPCSLYLLASTLCNLVDLNVGIIPVIYTLDHPDPTASSLLFCKLQFYFRHGPNQMMRAFIILACIDRYTLCTMHVRLRSFSRYRVATRLILIVVVFWLVLSIFPSIARSIQNGSCNIFNSVNALIYSIYLLVTAGFFPPIAMTISGLLVLYSLKQMRARVQPTTSRNPSTGVLRKRDRDLIRMLLVEVMIYVITTMPFTIMLVYTTATQTVVKSQERKQLESFITYFTQSFLIYFNSALPFWSYLCASRSFNREVKHLIMHFFAHITGKQIRSVEESIGTVQLHTVRTGAS